MKRTHLVTITLLTAALGYGCSHAPKSVTHVEKKPGVTGPSNPRAESAENVTKLSEDEGITRSGATEDHSLLADSHDLGNYQKDPEVFKASTVYFAYDRVALDPTEATKLGSVTELLGRNQSAKVLIEGHCDERGTEEYNRSLGERRALAVREHLIALGISSDRLLTQSWGADRPAEVGHDEGAWAKNRRDVFVLLTPRQ